MLKLFLVLFEFVLFMFCFLDLKNLLKLLFGLLMFWCGVWLCDGVCFIVWICCWLILVDGGNGLLFCVGGCLFCFWKFVGVWCFFGFKNELNLFGMLLGLDVVVLFFLVFKVLLKLFLEVLLLLWLMIWLVIGLWDIDLYWLLYVDFDIGVLKGVFVVCLNVGCFWIELDDGFLFCICLLNIFIVFFFWILLFDFLMILFWLIFFFVLFWFVWKLYWFVLFWDGGKFLFCLVIGCVFVLFFWGGFVFEGIFWCLVIFVLKLYWFILCFEGVILFLVCCKCVCCGFFIEGLKFFLVGIVFDFVEELVLKLYEVILVGVDFICLIVDFFFLWNMLF